MQNYIQRGETIDVVLTEAVVSGGVVVLGDLAGIASNDGAIGDTVAVALEGVFSLPKAAGTAFTLGKKVYFDKTAGNIVATATSNTQVGYVMYPAAADATEVSVKLWPN